MGKKLKKGSAELATFWRNHIEQYEQSGLSKKAYTIKHKISYDCFQYWCKKNKVSQCSTHSLFIPIQPQNSLSTEPLATLTNKQGSLLQIYNLDLAAQALTQF